MTRRDEAAFTALVERHGPMVQRVCGEVLGDYHDAQDAFQATFLVLARQAELNSPARLTGELAVRRGLPGLGVRPVGLGTAAKARAELGRPGGRGTAASKETSREASGRLHAELGRLPERFRAAVVLCYLEGRTYEEAAQAAYAARWGRSRAGWQPPASA